jgi:hypothetical protein
VCDCKYRSAQADDHDLHTEAGENCCLRDILPSERGEVTLLRRVQREQISGGEIQGSGEE